MRLSISVARPNLISLGTCFGKFSKSGKFKLHVTALDYLAQYARYKIWLKPNGEMPFLYGNHILKAHLGRITEDTPEHQGVVVFNMSDTPLGFGVTARSTVDTRKLDPTAIIVFHQALPYETMMSAHPYQPHTRWQNAEDDELTVHFIHDIFDAVDDDLWVAAACADRLVNDVDVQRELLELGLSRTSSAVDRARASLVQEEFLNVYFGHVPGDAQLCQLRSIFLDRLDKLSSFVEIYKTVRFQKSDDIDSEWEDDPWDNDPQETHTSSKPGLPAAADLHIPLPKFLVMDIVDVACFFASLESIPTHASPSEYSELLPGYDVSQGAERVPRSQGWRSESDWVESQEGQGCSYTFTGAPSRDPLDPLELTAWYARRADDVIASTGMLDIALETVRHGISLECAGSGTIGKKTLVSLHVWIYDTPQPSESSDAEDWTLSRWKSLEPGQVVQAYLAHSTQETQLVMPYLFVLDARAERAGQPDPNLAVRLLYDYSKPTLPLSQRIIRNDEDLVRLALTCLYTPLFECLPAWDIQPGTEDEADEADATITSLGTFVTPSTTVSCCSAADLLLFFKPLPLDSHLMSGEILSRWNVPRARANRMARRTGRSSGEMKSKDDWEWLLEDMHKLRATSKAGIKGAFGLIPKVDISSIFLSGLLSSGLFDIASEFLHKKPSKLSLPVSVVEDICLSVSREFYDNATSANFKMGDMKLAYDCLAVWQPSKRLSRERDFIEATSRISSYNVCSRPGIRLTKDRLSLISRILSGTVDAYKHTQVILDLLYKLGYKGDPVAEVKTLAMLSDTALQADDFTRAYETSQRMIETVLQLRAEIPAGPDDPSVREACEVCWVACYQLGRHPEFKDVEKKLVVFGRALEFCPEDKLSDLLTSWRRLQRDDLESRRESISKRMTRRQRHPAANRKSVSSLQARLTDLHLPMAPLINAEDAAALAGRAFNRVASTLPFTVSGRGRSNASGDDTRARSRDGSGLRLNGEDVSAHASRALQRGIGWLLGADEN
ncbi:secretory pathway protein Sec39-domain-containing protein [Pisolithus marmoratus]|nr:secretory pathway protein Sec39-domain-containing protein [Pisolithus marmoratus]